MNDPLVDPLVSTAWLAQRLDSADLRIVDATWFMPGEGKLGRDAYAAGHIPGAVHFDIDEIADHGSDLPHMLPTPDAFAAAAGRLGLRRDLTTVVYDGQGIFSAPRVWWTLRTMGFPEVFVLDGGLPKWRAEGRPLETVAPQPQRTTIEPALDPSLVRDLDSVRATLAAHDAQVIDARSAPRFRGDIPEPRAGLRAGHMPGAINLPWNVLLNPDGTLKTGDELRAAFQAAGVDLDGPMVTTCGSGVSAALLALALARLGREDVAVYDGSWTEWGGRADTPIATGA
ncbi:MAG TPA: 3-mercaptopyruvate sulfurtransferase [Phenylobacterium sp.]|jgi:thiosulfate/3-mercaptopyruvate sulfurtransferase|uniref:3-mercaptopyruvate sulfurtransferase n=1 Tax=Phenylobacterium sp. TaxID=1871053 RepID=UPI002D25988F|nr:3-mercaptopyruvate sulfurtransferase [Phenylobacterium sp.]HZZ67007.1 3-mercaptopyruvate sulfurtransferase [Phenylobacterium sp.]